MPNDIILLFRDEFGDIVTNVKHKWIAHSPNGFEWGYKGSGPSDLALNILLEFVDKDIAWKLHHLFKDDFIVEMPIKGGTISSRQVKQWLEAKNVECKL